jgi:hypothetical protein
VDDTQSIQFQCPHCRKQLQAHVKLVGKRVRCEKCARVVDVPLPLANRDPTNRLGS